MGHKAGWHALGHLRARDRRRAALWLPVCFGIGIWLYFRLAVEPASAWASLALALLVLIGPAGRAGWAARALVLALVAGTAGFSVATLQTARVAAPVLADPVAETVEGRMIAVSRSRAGAPRLLLDRVRVYGLAPGETPARVRISIIGADRAALPPVGHRVRVHARLFPPGGPAEPGAFDFRRSAFFARLGGVGYVRGAAVLDLGPGAAAGWIDQAALWLAERRAGLAAALAAHLPGPEGAFAAAIVTGDRSRIAEADAEALRAANLAHLLAISGLHMGMLCGLVFAATRLALALVPAIALSVPVKKIAAGAALAAGAGYLALSGATVATQRAFAMVAVALVAVLIDRPAITLRALAVAAMIVMVIRPVSVTEVGFQMSFAATIALVAAFEAWRTPGARGGLLEPRRWPRRLALYAAGVLFTSLVAGLATAPYAAAAFNRAAPWGLAANLAAVPVMGVAIAPMALVAGFLAPFGLAAAPLAAMGAGIGWVLAVAHEVASWPGAVRPVPPPPGGALALVTLGGLWLAIWRGQMRLAGLAPLALGLGLWSAPAERPALLIGPGARLVGVMGPEGRVIDHPRAQGFVAETWLRRDADPADQETAAARPGILRRTGGFGADLPHGWRLVVRHSRAATAAELADLCRPRTLLVARHGPPVSGACTYVGAAAIAGGGAIAATPSGPDPGLESAAGGRCRPWTPCAGPETDP